MPNDQVEFCHGCVRYGVLRCLSVEDAHLTLSQVRTACLRSSHYTVSTDGVGWILASLVCAVRSVHPERGEVKSGVI